MTLSLLTAGFVLGALAGVFFPAVGLPLCLGALALWVLFRVLRRLSRVRPLLLGCALALVWVTGYAAVFHGPAQAMAYRTISMEGVVVNWPEETDHGAAVPVKAGEQDGRPVRAILYGDKDLCSLRPGDRLSCVAYCTPADQMADRESLYYYSKGILLTMKSYGPVTVTPAEGTSPRYALPVLAQSIRDLIDRLYPEPQAGFLHALLTGDKTGLTHTDQNNLNRVGLGHVVVISGLHVTFLAGFLSLFLKKQRLPSILLLILIMVLFSLMTGNAPGTVRATILCSMTLVAPVLGRSYHPLTGLSAALLLLLAVNPFAVANAGLQFSFLSTLGIQLFGQRWNRSWREALPKPCKKVLAPLVGVLAISLSAMLFTVPLSALYFRQFSLIAPVSNLLTAWSVSLAFLGGLVSLVAGALFFPLGALLAKVVGLPIAFFLWYAEQASRLPLAAITREQTYFVLWTGFVYGLLLLYLLVPAREKRPILPLCACVVTFCLSALLTVGSVQRENLTLSVLDVGQGQSILLSAGEACALVDCGGPSDPGDTAATALQAMGRSTLDLLVLTHFHDDHAGGVPELMERVSVRAIALPDVDRESPLRQEIEALAREQGTELHYITSTRQVDLDGASLTLYTPVSTGGDSNEQCVSVLCASGSWEGLITGDMPLEGEAALLARETLPDLELLVAGHHGSKYATGELLLKTLTPEIVVISVGHNSYGHPAPETLARLAAISAQVYRTDQTGTVRIHANSGEA